MRMARSSTSSPILGGDAADWSAIADSLPGFTTLRAVAAADPAELRPAALVDAIRGCERLLSHVAALQASLITEFAEQSADTPTPDGRDLAEQTWSRARFDLVLAPDTTATQPTAAEEQLAAPCGESTNNHSSE